VKRTAVIFVVLTLFGSGDAKAQQFDLSTMTCDSFLKGDKDQMKLITAWLAGYYTDESAAEVVDVSALDKMQDQLVKFCTRETSFPIENAADGIFGQEAGNSSDAASSSSGTAPSGH
jgi:HdeA/HdeB family